jgi:multidrug efflux pump subunit AcrB
MKEINTDKGIIAWFAHNPVAANLLMIVIVVLGLLSASNIRRTMMPEFEIDIIQVTMPYPGAAPEEVEQGIVLKIEEALIDLKGIKRIESEARESFAILLIEPDNPDDIMELMNNVKNRIDAIAHFPEDAEKPVTGRIEIGIQAMFVQISGELDERTMKQLAEEIKADLLAYEEISQVEIWGARDYEIAVEISEHQLREYHLTLGEVANIIAASSLDLPGGSVRTETGDIMLRTTGQAYTQAEFEKLVLKTYPDGTRLLLGDIANIRDGFVDGSGFAAFNGQYSIGLSITALGEQDLIEAAEVAHEYVELKNRDLPQGVELTIWSDFSYYLNQRLTMMLKNLGMGALVVFLVLALFLEIKLAFWVMIGIPICFLGSMAAFGSPWVGGTLNVVSLFGFILVLGIVVDDAIIIGEAAYTEQERRGHSIKAIVTGAKRVATPATFGVLTTIAAFAPTLFIEGTFGVFGDAVGYVVIFCLVFSLIESKWILPAHLAHSQPAKSGILASIDHVQQMVNAALREFVHLRYRPFVERCVKNRYLTLATFLSLLILTAGLILGGQIRYVMMPESPPEFIEVEIKMEDGTPKRRTIEVIGEIARGLAAAEADAQSRLGPDEKWQAYNFAYGYDLINGAMLAELTKQETRRTSTKDVMRAWRDKVGSIPGAEVLSFKSADGPDPGADISFDLVHPEWEVLKKAALELEAKLATYDGVFDIRSGASSTSDEFHIDILPQAEALGITRYDLGSQVRHAFYGAEAQRIQRGQDEIKVMVRYPDADRETTASLDSMFIRTPQGDEVPFSSVAKLEVKEGFNATTHINFRRAVEVRAGADEDKVEPTRISNEIVRNFLPELAERYPGLKYYLSGMSEETEKMARSMIIGFGLAMFVIYALLAIPTRSYLQPLIIMGVIPFGIIGAVIGHMLTGYAISMMSFLGIIALSGVVVNDSLIMVDYINRALLDGTPKTQAIVQAGTQRFRAIMLTSATTFLGLIPILMEKSAQVQTVVPMAISLAFGIVFATVITLILVPSLYMILDDLDSWWKRGREIEEDPVAQEEADWLAGT